MTTVGHKRHRAWTTHGLLPDDTHDLIEIWLGSPAFFKVLDMYLDRTDRMFVLLEHLSTMDFHDGATDFFLLFPPVLLLLNSSALRAHVGGFHWVLEILLAAVCFFAVNCMFALAGHSVLRLGEVMDAEHISKTRVDTDVFSALAFLGMLVCEGLSQLVFFALVGGYLGFFLSLIVTLAMLGTVTTMNVVRVSNIIHDSRILQKAAQSERKNRIDEVQKKAVKLESTIEGLHFRLYCQKQKYEDLQQANLALRRAKNQTQDEVESLENALMISREGFDVLSKSNKILQATLAETQESHDEAFAAQEQHYLEESTKDKAHVETLARMKMDVELKKWAKAHHETMSNRYAKASVILQERYQHALEKKRKEHASALAAKETQHQDALTEAMEDGHVAGHKEAIDFCQQWCLSTVEGADSQHAIAMSEKEELHEVVLAKKEKEFAAYGRKLRDSRTECHKSVLRFYGNLAKDAREQHARAIEEKDQRLADLQARVDRYPEIWLAEEEADDSSNDENDPDEGYVSVIDNGEKESQDEEEIDQQDKEDAESHSDEDSKSQGSDDAGSQYDGETDSEYDTDEQDAEPVTVADSGSDVDFCVDGDSDDELREWAVVG